jgi:hypothetical protein
MVRLNLPIDTDAQVRPLPSVAPVLVRRSSLRYVALVMGLIFGSLFACLARAGDLPCGIVTIRKSNTGVILQFDRKRSWRFSQTNGDFGVIGLVGVVLFERKGEELKEPVYTSGLSLGLNEQVDLSDHHTGCRLVLSIEGDRWALRASGGFSYPGMKSTSFETTVYP